MAENDNNSKYVKDPKNQGDPNPSENTPQEEAASPKETFQHFMNSLGHYLNIREGVDVAGTIESVKADVEFKGYNIYILIFSIFIASIGLNVDSTAVIIGAMLISPLMGPIVGVGLAIGITDIKLLNKSLKNLGATVLFSVAASTLYFYITPIHEDSHELLARTTPTLLDAFVAIFGGLAGIMAASRRAKTNVVPGVAIATALMPPLCTAGYGLASLNWNFFFGAFYLFLLNSILICLTTTLIVRYVGFPRVDFINPQREKKVKRIIYAFTLLVLIPSGYIFWNVINESIFRQRAQRFITSHIESENTSVINHTITYNRNGGKIKLFLMGDRISDERVDELKQQLTLDGLENCQLVIRQDKDISGDLKADLSGSLKEQVKSDVLDELFEKNQTLLAERDKTIKDLEMKLQSLYGDSVPNYVLRKELRVNYPEVQSTYFATIEHTVEGRSDTIPTVFVHFKKGTYKSTRKKQSTRLAKWLTLRLNLDTMRVLEY